MWINIFRRFKGQSEDEVPIIFDISKLIWLMYDDFLNQIKRGAAAPDQIAMYLLAGMKKQFQVSKVEKRIMKPITNYLFKFETVEEDEIEEPK
jgi:hypothetical protein